MVPATATYGDLLQNWSRTIPVQQTGKMLVFLCYKRGPVLKLIISRGFTRINQAEGRILFSSLLPGVPGVYRTFRAFTGRLPGV